MLIRISHRSYKAYYPYVIQILYWYFLSYTYSELTLIDDLFLFRSPVGHVFILISRKTHTYTLFSSYAILSLYIYLSTYSYLYLSQISRRSSQNLCLYRDTLRYYKAYTYTIGLILILRSLHLFGGTRRYYRDITEYILVLRNLLL